MSISNNVICATSKDSDQPAHIRSLIGVFSSRMNFLWGVMLLTEHHFEFPSLKGDCTGSSESELTLKALLYATLTCSFVISIRCSGSGVILIVSIPDICVLPYFLYSHEYGLTRNTVFCAILSDQIVVGCPLGVPISYYYLVVYLRYIHTI